MASPFLTYTLLKTVQRRHIHRLTSSTSSSFVNKCLLMPATRLKQIGATKDWEICEML